MARRYDETSCTAIGCGAVVVLLLWIIVPGYLLALPVAMPDLLSEQSPPQEMRGAEQYAVVYGLTVVTAAGITALASRRRPFVWWVLLARTALLLVLALAAVHWVEPRVASQVWNIRAMTESGAAGLTAFVFHRALLWWDAAYERRNGGRVSSAPGRRPVRGQIWLALVPFRDSEEESQHYCVVMRTRFRHAEVLQITTKNKDGRPDFVRIPNEGWDEVSGRDHWVEIGLPPRKVRYGKFLKSRPRGRCPEEVWRRLRERQPVPQPVAAGRSGVWSRITRYLGRRPGGPGPLRGPRGRAGLRPSSGRGTGTGRGTGSGPGSRRAPRP